MPTPETYIHRHALTMALLLPLAAACCPAPYVPGPTEPQRQEPGLGFALANATSDAVAQVECGDHFAWDSDGWHACVCGLETWRCQAQGWCGDPRGDAPLEAPSAEAAVRQEGCE